MKIPNGLWEAVIPKDTLYSVKNKTDKQWSAKHYTDWAIQTEDELKCAPEGLAVPVLLVVLAVLLLL